MKFNNRNVFISNKAKIGKNVKIGDIAIIYYNVEIVATSLVTKNINPFSIMIGSLAKFIIDSIEIISKTLNKKYYYWIYNFESGK